MHLTGPRRAKCLPVTRKYLDLLVVGATKHSWHAFDLPLIHSMMSGSPEVEPCLNEYSFYPASMPNCRT